MIGGSRRGEPEPPVGRRHTAVLEGVDHLQLVVRDLAASRRFYEAVMQVIGVPPGHRVTTLSVGNGQLDRLDTMSRAIVGTQSQITVAGETAQGRTYSCSGRASADIAVPATWTCTTCLGDDCTTCDLAQRDGCLLP